MAPMRLVSNRQLELIVEFAERNRDIAINNKENGPLDQREANEAWNQLAKDLNALGGGPSKTPEKWKRYWHLLKCRTKAKAADIRRCMAEVGDAGSKMAPLTAHEKRIVRVLGKIVPVERMATPLGTTRVVARKALPVRRKIKPVSVKVESEIGVTEDERVQVTSRSRKNEDDNVPQWVCNLEERRIDAEERLADAVVTLSATNEAMLQCMQQMAASQAQLVRILDAYIHPTKEK